MTSPSRRAVPRTLALLISTVAIVGGVVLGIPGVPSSLPTARAAEAAQTARAGSGATLQIGSAPGGLAVSPDGKTLYVASPSTNSVLVFNTVTRKRVATIAITGSLGGTDVGSAPEFLQLNRSGSKLYVSMTMSNTDGNTRALVVIDTASRQMVDVFSFPGLAFPFAVSPDGSRAYVPTFTCGITILDLTAGSSTPPLFDNLGTDCVITNVVATADGRLLYAMDPNNSRVKVLDATTSTPALLDNMDTPGRAFAGAISPDGHTLSLFDAGSLTVDLLAVDSFDPSRATLLASIGGGEINSKTLFLPDNPAGTVVYRVNSSSKQIDVIDVVKKKVTRQLATGPDPEFFAVNRSGTTFYTANEGDDSVSIIPITASTIHSGSAGSQPAPAPTTQTTPPVPTFTPIAAPVPSSAPTVAALATSPTSAGGLNPLVVGLIILIVLLLAAATVLAIVLVRRSGATG